MNLRLFDQPPTVVLRDYQEAALDNIAAFWSHGGRRGLVAMATGLGKTVVFACLPERFGRMLVIAHREELLDQAAAKIQAANPTLAVGVEQAYRSADKGSGVVVASIQTLSSRGGRRLAALSGEFGIVVVDEAHHSTARTYAEALAHFGLAPDVRGLRQAVLEAGGDGLAVQQLRREYRDQFREFKPGPAAPLLMGFTATPNR